jgi:hypothetical protein
MSAPSPRRRIALVLALLAAAVGLFFATCERSEVVLPRGYVGAAARDPYLAAERMLDRMRMPTRSFDDVGALSSLPPVSSTLIIPTERRSLGEHTSAQLLDWAARGGHLIVVSWQIWDDPNRRGDPILDPLDVRQFMNRDSGDDEGDAQQLQAPAPGGPGGDDQDDDSGEPALADAEFPDRDEPLQLRFDQRFRLEVDASVPDEDIIVEAGDDAGSHLVTLRHGQGLVTALSDDYFMTQPQIGDLDHAEMVYRLTRLGGHRGPVWIVYGDQFPSLWRLLLRNGWMVVASAGVLLALWLWSVVRRQGPIAPDPAPARRELMEHVRAAGRLEWQRGGGLALVQAVRAALFARMRERHPSFHTQTPREQVAQLEALSGLPAERIDDALAYRQDRDPVRFTAKIALLEKLRRSL